MINIKKIASFPHNLCLLENFTSRAVAELFLSNRRRASVFLVSSVRKTGLFSH